jgi:hypothetical protein
VIRKESEIVEMQTPTDEGDKNGVLQSNQVKPLRFVPHRVAQVEMSHC